MMKEDSRTEVICVYLVEDDPEIRAMLSEIIDDTSDLITIGAAADAERALDDRDCSNANVVLMDIGLPGMSGIDCVRALRLQNSGLDILMLTVHDHDQYIFDALCAGACGYLVKGTEPGRVLSAIREAFRGGAPMSMQIARRVVQSFRNPRDAVLTKRENDVLSLLCHGASYKEIAERLYVTNETVRSHIKSIYRKLEVHSKSQAVAKTLRHNLLA